MKKKKKKQETKQEELVIRTWRHWTVFRVISNVGQRNWEICQSTETTFWDVWCINRFTRVIQGSHYAKRHAATIVNTKQWTRVSPLLESFAQSTAGGIDLWVETTLFQKWTSSFDDNWHVVDCEIFPHPWETLLFQLFLIIFWLRFQISFIPVNFVQRNGRGLFARWKKKEDCVSKMKMKMKTEEWSNNEEVRKKYTELSITFPIYFQISFILLSCVVQRNSHGLFDRSKRKEDCVSEMKMKNRGETTANARL